MENLTTTQVQRLDAALATVGPDLGGHRHLAGLPTAAGLYHAPSPGEGRRRAERVIHTLHTCPIPEVAPLGWTLRAWRTQVQAYFHTRGVSNGGTQAINGAIESAWNGRPRSAGFVGHPRWRAEPLPEEAGRDEQCEPFSRADPCRPRRAQGQHLGGVLRRADDDATEVVKILSDEDSVRHYFARFEDPSRLRVCLRGRPDRV
jgi:transposase